MPSPTTTTSTRLVVDNNAREVLLDGRVVELTRVEFDLLAKLYGHPRMVISHEQLSRSVLGSDWYTGPHSIAVHIGHIRHKLGQAPDQPGFIVNKRGVGYMYDPRGQLQAFLPAIPACVDLCYNRDLQVVSIEPSDHELFGWQPAELIGTRFMVPVEKLTDFGNGFEVIQLMIALGVTGFSVSALVNCSDGSAHSAKLQLDLVLDAAGAFDGMRARVTPIG